MDDPIPESHLDSLADVEATYFWHCGRVDWAADLIFRHCANPSHLNVVDFGCGTGGTLHALNRRFRFRSALGVDLSPEAIAHARRFEELYEVVDIDRFRLPPGTNLVLVMDVLEHVKDDRGLLSLLLRQLGADGKVLVAVPAGPVFFSDWDRQLGHYRRYTRASLENLVAAAGGRIDRISYGFSHLIPTAVLRRFGVMGNSFNGEFPSVPRLVNGLLRGIGACELMVARLLPIPLGTSLFTMISANHNTGHGTADQE